MTKWFRKCALEQTMRNRRRKRKAPKARSKEEKCVIPWCRNRQPITTDGKRKRVCWRCSSRKFKESRPVTYVLNMIRSGAKRRGIAFSLTLRQFQLWCEETGYLEKRGRAPGSLTVDRRDSSKGYHIWNIQAMSHEENSEQGANNTPRERNAEEYEEGPF